MADIVSAHTRSRMMSGIRSTNTKPELLLRRGLHKLGYRYKLNDSSLPGSPDMVFPRYNAVIFANGCFWHRHNCHLFKMPSTRSEFWNNKFDANVAKDRRAVEALLSMGWRVCVVWECAMKGKTRISSERLFSICDHWLQSSEQEILIEGVK